MHDIVSSFISEETIAKTTFELRAGKGEPLIMPTKTDLETISNSFIQKADHAIQKLFDLVKIFYGEAVGKRWFESFTNHVTNEYGENDLFAKFMNDSLPMLQLLRNTRNCVEHPQKNKQQISVTNFTINSQLKISPPTI